MRWRRSYRRTGGGYAEAGVEFDKGMDGRLKEGESVAVRVGTNIYWVHV